MTIIINRKAAVALILCIVIVGLLVLTKSWIFPATELISTRRPPPDLITQSSPAEESSLANQIQPSAPPTHRLQVLYRDFSKCEKPQYLSQYKSHCWGECKDDHSCSQPATYDDITAGRAHLACFENFFIIGVRKSGSTDISRYFLKLNNICINKKCDYLGGLGAEDYYPDRYCPMKFFAHRFPVQTKVRETDRIYHYGPGTLVSSGLYFQNSTHLIVSPATQFLGFMATSDTKFHIQIRHPTDRAISYLFHWHRESWIFPDISHKQFSKLLTDYLLLGLLRQLEECIRDHGELGCIYQSTGLDGDLRNLLKHSLYVIYIEEAFKFIPREQIVITQMEEYGEDETKTIKKVMDVFGVEYQDSKYFNGQSKKVSNKGNKNPVSEDVIQALDDFFMPYNQRLAKLLNDDKFLYTRKTAQE